MHRARSLAAPLVIAVLSLGSAAAQQAAGEATITAQLGRWHRMSLDVRDRELQLHEVNKELRALSPEDLDDPQTRRQV